MRKIKKRYLLVLIVCAWIGAIYSFASAEEKIKDEFAQAELILQYDKVLPDSNSAIEIKIELEKDWHFYADANAAPYGMSLKVTPSASSGQAPEAKGLIFSRPVFPKAQMYFDPVTNQKQAVYSGTFNVFVPFKAGAKQQESEIKVSIEGLSCSQELCRKASYELSTKIEISKQAKMEKARFEVTIENPLMNQGAKYVAVPFDFAQGGPATAKHIVLPLAILAGLLLNVMPCVWPVLPIIVLRLVGQAEKSKGKSIISGIAFGIGIILFFAALAAASIILKLGFGIIFQWGDQFRNQPFIIGMAILMVVLALYMFGLFTFAVPASMSGSGKQSGGLSGSIGMGFLAAVLSTPCSFGILAFVLAWAQTQPIPLATITILLIGVGMALPYVILAAMPGLLNKIPKPGRWMELFKHATGFILLGIGVKLLEAIRLERIIDVLYYAIVISVCVWMWGVWVQYNTPKAKKRLIRIAAIILAIVFGFLLLSEPKKEIIDWQSYDAGVIAAAQEANKPVLIKFTADWCFSCKVLDKTVYSSKETAGLIKSKGVLAIKADTTEYDYPASKALKEIYNEPAVPVTVLLLPGNKTPVKLAGNLIKKELIENLRTLKDSEK